MRLKIILPVLLLALAAFGTIFLVKHHFTRSTSLPADKPVIRAEHRNVQRKPNELTDTFELPERRENTPAHIRPATLPPLESVAQKASETDSEVIDAEIERLQEWSSNHDASSLSNILSGLSSSNREVRQAAIDAAKQFGSTNAIPALKAAAETASDLREKIDFLEAAEFLSLPPLPMNSLPAGLQEHMKTAAREMREAEMNQSGGQN